MARSALINVMVQAASKAGRSLIHDFNEVENLQISVKGPSFFALQADLKAAKILRNVLNKARPDYSFLMEKNKSTTQSNDRWIVDPLNGTMNFLHSVPLFSVSIALERQGQLIAGVIYNPITEELFTAEKGTGAYMNDRRIRVGARNNLDTSLIVIDIPNHPSTSLSQQKVLMAQVSGIRATGSSTLNLAWLAAGRFDGYWENNLNAWEIAAGMLMVREAGGFVTAPTSNESIYKSGRLVAGNEYIHAQLVNIVNKG
ncbi:inositol monophosphatase family protein [Candidatus Endowatersipora endosymbiont of Watersipora subatra]|uniref:inositol monophosphatase family protein n=1 Tax=Candidatus Endowatersipora endosymbiont of Watersipora subatra TaxID=3077946 RepID=UPI00312C7E74